MEKEVKEWEWDLTKQTNSFKLSKMSKGYNWEIKFFDDDIEIIKSKIKELDNWARENFGKSSETNFGEDN